MEKSSMKHGDDKTLVASPTIKSLSTSGCKKLKSFDFLEDQNITTVEILGNMSNEDYQEVVTHCKTRQLKRHVDFLRCLARLLVVEKSLPIAHQISYAIGATSIPINELQVVESYILSEDDQETILAESQKTMEFEAEQEVKVGNILESETLTQNIQIHNQTNASESQSVDAIICCFKDFPLEENQNIPGFSFRQLISSYVTSKIDSIPENVINDIVQVENLLELYAVIGIRVDSPLVQPLIVANLRCFNKGVSTFSIILSWIRQLFQIQTFNLLGDAISKRNSATEVDTDSKVTIHVMNLSGVISKQDTNLENLMGVTLNEEVEAKLTVQPGNRMLYHGTTINNATNIVRLGIDLTKCSDNTDFGKGFYVSSQPSVALSYAILSSDINKQDPAVVAFEISDRDFSGLLLWNLVDEQWKDIVVACRRCCMNGLEKHNQALVDSFEKCDIIGGQISQNATKIECGHTPIPSEHHQFAFKSKLSNRALKCHSVIRINSR